MKMVKFYIFSTNEITPYESKESTELPLPFSLLYLTNKIKKYLDEGVPVLEVPNGKLYVFNEEEFKEFSGKYRVDERNIMVLENPDELVVLISERLNSEPSFSIPVLKGKQEYQLIIKRATLAGRFIAYLVYPLSLEIKESKTLTVDELKGFLSKHIDFPVIL